MNRLAALLLALGATARAQSTLPEWTLGASPLVTIGGDGSPRTEFLNIQGVVRLANGNIAVANMATSELRVFDGRGNFLSSFGRKGQGPGEFEWIRLIARAGDTAFFYDGSLRRISKVLLAGTPRLIGEMPVSFEAPEGESFVSGRLPDGRWMTRGLGMPDVQSTKGLFRIPGYIGIANASASGAVKWQPPMPDGDAFIFTPPLSLAVAAFPAEMEAVVSGDAVWFGDGKTDSLFRLNPTTGERKTVKLEPGPAVTSAMIDAARASELENAKNDRERAIARSRYSPEYVPKRLGTYVALVAGPRGEVWAQRGTAAQTDQAEYTVLSSAGTRLARVKTAPGFRIREVGTDYVAGVHRDDDGVETVRVYSLKRGP